MSGDGSDIDGCTFCPDMRLGFAHQTGSSPDQRLRRSITIMSTITKASTTSPAHVYFGAAETILADRERIKRETIANRRLRHRLQATSQMSQNLPSRKV
jgi:hypothetical protein